MLWRAAKIIFQLVGGLGAGSAIIFSLLAWQLSKGPVSLGFLTEHLERALNDSLPTFKLKVGDTILTWAGWQRALDIRVLDVTLSLADGTRIGRIPEAWFSLSGDALLQGNIAPQMIEFYGPRLSVRRGADGARGWQRAARPSGEAAGADRPPACRRGPARLREHDLDGVSPCLSMSLHVSPCLSMSLPVSPCHSMSLHVCA